MLQIYFENLFLPLAIIFMILGLISFGWLVVHVEHSRHASYPKIVFSLFIACLMIGFGIHFLLLSFGL